MTLSRSGPRPGLQPMEHRKAQDQAMILPLLGLVLLMPPFGAAFQLDLKIAGIPFTLVYLFAVWALLILCGWRLSRRLGAAAAPEAEVQDANGGRDV